MHAVCTLAFDGKGDSTAPRAKVIGEQPPVGRDIACVTEATSVAESGSVGEYRWMFICLVIEPSIGTVALYRDKPLPGHCYTVGN